MEAFPLVFTFRDIVAGDGFFAGVLAKGRAVITAEADGYCWMSGVNPGGVAAGGCQAEEALRSFKDRYLSVLFDIAGEAETFDAFAREVRWFFDTVDSEGESEWLATRDKVRAGQLGGFGNLPRSTETDFGISVHLLEVGSPENNPSVDFAEAA